VHAKMPLSFWTIFKNIPEEKSKRKKRRHLPSLSNYIIICSEIASLNPDN
jgi:hypothetical protein